MAEQIRVPERAAARIVTAVQRQEAAQAAMRETAETVADALGVPPGWVLDGDGEGLYFAEVASPNLVVGAGNGDANAPTDSNGQLQRK